MIIKTIALFTILIHAYAHAAMKVSQGKLTIIQDFPSNYIEPRVIRIWTPNDYKSETNHAVLFMNDGQMLFDSATTWNGQEWGVDETAQRLIDSSKVKSFIVVGIDNIPSKRHAEYFPQKPFESMESTDQTLAYELERAPGQLLFGGTRVQSDAYLKFIVEELKPYILKNYSVSSATNEHYIMGASMGGLISWYAINEYPNQFGGAASLSTHWLGGFEPKDSSMFDAFCQYLEKELLQPQRFKLYFDHGDQTLDQHYPPYQEKINALLARKNYQEPLTKTLFFKGAEHSENAWQARLDIPLIFLLGNHK